MYPSIKSTMSEWNISHSRWPLLHVQACRRADWLFKTSDKKPELMLIRETYRTLFDSVNFYTVQRNYFFKCCCQCQIIVEVEGKSKINALLRMGFVEYW